MTEIPLLQTHAVPQLSPRAPFAPVPYPIPNGHPAVDPSEPDDEPISDTIKCICGYELDDGHSVFCELCRTWQHVHCYYEGQHAIPAIHECVDCHPRAMDMQRVNTRKEKFRTGEYMIEDEKEETTKARRPATKSHKKKSKDTNAAAQVNGVSYDHDAYPGVHRKSGSPRDQQPPTKRPKPTHKSTGSVASLNHAAVNSSSRKRATSAVQPIHSPVKSPTTPVPNGYSGDYFSPEFLQLYRRPEYDHIEANSYSDLGIAMVLRTWVSDPEETKKASGGKTPGEIFHGYNGDLKDLEETGPQLKENTGTGSQPSVQGACPTWKWVTTETFVHQGGFVGELKGQIGRREDYCSNPNNRWQTLRHPEPFVFFVPFLPLYVDTRQEGTLLRYVRRSCRPNIRLQTIITNGSDYHFCFIAMEDILPGEEISIAWDIDKEVHKALGAYVQNGNAHERGLIEVEAVSQWVAGVLSNFGGCACKLPPTECFLARADLRNGIYLSHHAKHGHKKPRKNGTHVSPSSTGHATNSRAGSEARIRDRHCEHPEDENGDSRSVSGSSRSKPTSRDITPMTHVSNDNPAGLGVEMSDREKRKLMQQEKLFEQLEHDEQHAQKKRKRNSAGSALNTPGVATSKQLGHPESSFAPPVVPSRARADSSRSGNANGRRSHKRTSGRSRREPPSAKKPQYQDSSMQTEPDDEFPSLVPVRVERRKPKGSFLRTLLQRTHDGRIERERSESVLRNQPDARTQTDGEKMDVDESASSPKTVSSKPATSPREPTPVSPVNISAPKPPSTPLKAEDDIEMQDAPAAAETEPRKLDTPVSPRTMSPPRSSTESNRQTSHPPLPPPPPPWSLGPSSTLAVPSASSTASTGEKSVSPDPNTPFPPPPTFRTTTPPPADEAFTSNSTTTGGVIGSPSLLTHSVSASISSPENHIVPVVTPSPVQRKAKMSLSDWTKKRKAKEKAASAEHEVPGGAEETHRVEEKEKERSADSAAPLASIPAIAEVAAERPVKMDSPLPAPMAPMTTEITTGERREDNVPPPHSSQESEGGGKPSDDSGI